MPAWTPAQAPQQTPLNPAASIEAGFNMGLNKQKLELSQRMQEEASNLARDKFDYERTVAEENRLKLDNNRSIFSEYLKAKSLKPGPERDAAIKSAEDRGWANQPELWGETLQGYMKTQSTMTDERFKEAESIMGDFHQHLSPRYDPATKKFVPLTTEEKARGVEILRAKHPELQNPDNAVLNNQLTLVADNTPGAYDILVEMGNQSKLGMAAMRGDYNAMEAAQKSALERDKLEADIGLIGAQAKKSKAEAESLESGDAKRLAQLNYDIKVEQYKKAKLDIQKAEKEIENIGELDTSQAYTAIKGIKTTLDQELTQYDASRMANRRIKAAWEDLAGEPESANVQGQTIIVGYLKLLEPTSVVRESEFDRSVKGQSLVNRFRSTWGKYKKGDVISKGQLGEFVKLAQAIEESDAEDAAKYVENARRTATLLKIPEDTCITQSQAKLLPQYTTDPQKNSIKVYRWGNNWYTYDGDQNLNDLKQNTPAPQAAPQ